MMRRIYDAMFGEDEFREEREELRNRREQIEEEPEIEDEEDASSDASRGSRDLPMNVKNLMNLLHQVQVQGEVQQIEALYYLLKKKHQANIFNLPRQYQFKVQYRAIGQ